ncbi:type II toxin-antitoxin system ParD family antitoxin [Spirulina major]|uniref:type II toxin-antitoxin system ParD family antitoxin n=1 Tax=Spirulina major TaxID=270636 RepID=UPI001C31BAC5|nr:type II toxin-antitoxin system ParD family antitoxin [Spirulina major]
MITVKFYLKLSTTPIAPQPHQPQRTAAPPTRQRYVFPWGLGVLSLQSWQEMTNIAIMSATLIKHRAMKTMNVSLPDTMRDYIEEQVKIGGYGSISEYMRDLIRQDQKRKAQEQLETRLLAGLNSGPAMTMNDRDWADIRQAVQERLKGKEHG